MQPRRVQREVVAIAFPARRNDDHRVHAGGIHLVQQIIGRKRLRAMRCVPRRPRPLGRARSPDVHLRIDDQH
jgi:hypothetical protein